MSGGQYSQASQDVCTKRPQTTIHKQNTMMELVIFSFTVRAVLGRKMLAGFTRSVIGFVVILTGVQITMPPCKKEDA